MAIVELATADGRIDCGVLLPRTIAGETDIGPDSGSEERCSTPIEPDWLSIAAHELRAPLSALAISADLLLRDFNVLEEQEVQSMIAMIRRSALWLQTTVENVLYASLIREGRFQIRPSRESLIGVVKDTSLLVQPLLRQRRQKLTLAVRRGLPGVWIDRARIEHVLVNLILNASKFSPSGSSINVRLGSDRNAVRLAVSDRGPGVPEEARQQIFRPFIRAGSSQEASHPGGMGLGLWVVKAILDAHHGRIWVEDRSGGGAQFWLEIPTNPPIPH